MASSMDVLLSCAGSGSLIVSDLYSGIMLVIPFDCDNPNPVTMQSITTAIRNAYFFVLFKINIFKTYIAFPSFQNRRV
jgi:hypothetical protein